MNITELDQYNLSDAVKFNQTLNPRLWDDREQMRPEVREALLRIAEDFREFLGVNDLQLKDITVSGSNAAYTYTPGSDIDLHLVVDMPEQNADVYQELFNAKKFQYNNEHDIKIGNADVELYVQPSGQPHHSQGIFSIKNNQWQSVPRRRKIAIDDQCVIHKTEDLQHRIDSAIESGSQETMQRLWDKIKNMRQTGLESAGEFGCDNLVFKMLRKSGHIEQLKQAKLSAHDQALSLDERRRKKSKVKYGWSSFGGYWYPGTAYAGQDQPAGSEGSESVKESVDAESSPRLRVSLEQIVSEFVAAIQQELGIGKLPTIKLRRDPEWTRRNGSFGRYDPDANVLFVATAGRHVLDVLRTLAHELTHRRQDELENIPDWGGETGSRFEDEANAMAGRIMRHLADRHPEYFADIELVEGASGYIPKNKKEAQMPQYAMALSVDIKPGQTGTEANKLGLKTGPNGEPTLLMKSANLLKEYKEFKRQPSRNNPDLNDPPGPEFRPTMPAGTVKVDVSDVYDWYKLGTHISNLKGLGHHDFGAGPPSTIVSFGDEDTEHKFIQDLRATGLDVTDIDPRDPRQPPGMKKIKTDPTYNVDESEVLDEIKMSPTNLRAEAAKTGAMAGMEFEMIVPSISTDDADVEYEPDYDRDERCRSISDAVNFFFDGDYNGRRDVERLRERMQNDFEEWLDDKIRDAFGSDSEDYIVDWVANNVDESEWNPDDLEGDDRNEALIEFAVNVHADPSSDYFNAAFDEYREEHQEDWDESDWLDAEDLDTMSAIENAYDISWPYWNENSSGAGDIDQVADSFSQAIGRPVNASSRYHGGTREAGKYVVEPDGSLQPSNSDDMGLEFVSPPLPLDELLSDLNKVKAWADKNGCYTGKANKTGLHINVSVPGYDLSKLDYVKLALLLGDEYVLQQFGRSAESYAKSSMGKVREIVRQNPDRAQALLDKMRGHMNQFASRAIASGSTDKFVSINTLDKNGYIEFRSPGGDWLDANFEKIENTLMRFTVAMAAAIDPDAYREEYQKKLYKLLTQDQDKNNVDTIRHFADYVAGKIPQAALRSFVKQAQLKRQIARDPTGGKQYWWRVYKEGKGARNGAMIEVVARTKAEAIDKAGAEWGLFSREYRNIMDAEPVRPYEEKPAIKPVATGPQRDYEIVNLANRTVVERFRASSDEEAQEYFDRIIAPGDQLFYDVRPAPAAQPAAPQQTYLINNGSYNTSSIRSSSTEDAIQQFRDRISNESNPSTYSLISADNQVVARGGDQGTGTHTYRAFDLRNNQTLGTFQGGEPGSDSAAEAFADMLAREGISAQYADYELLGQERQRPQPTAQAAPQQSSGEFTGNWLIQDPQGRTIHRFGGVGNVQSDANRAAITWLRAHPGSMQAGVTVVPEMQ